MPGSHEKKSDYSRQLINSWLIWIQVGAFAFEKLFTSLRQTFVELQMMPRHDMQMWRSSHSSPARRNPFVRVSFLRFVSTDEMTSSALAFLNWVDYLLHVTCTWWDNTVKLRYFRTKSKFPPMKGKHKARRERSTNMKKLLKVCAFLRVGCFPS